MNERETVELSAAQARAARALLAWTQQDLAVRASVAASTVADFERGHRNPVSGNVAAIRKALEDAGISFPIGGAVVGTAPKPPAPGVAGTNPIRLIDATDLSNWANRRSCQDTLPELISRLIRASMGPAASLLFPSGDSVQQSGWDGVCKIDAATSDPYIPSGASGWEIGTQDRNIKAKANEDYEKRSADPLDLTPSRTTFVFITPRRWRKKREWVAEREKDWVWANVRAFDADDLVHWIELFPAVGAWLATTLGKRPVGVRQLDEAWREWSCSTRWPLSEDLILGDRDEQSTAVLRWLYGPPSVFAVQADSSVESEAFLYATLRRLPPEYQAYYYARTFLASTPDVARILSDSASRLLIVLEDADPGLATLLAQRGHHVYLTAAAGDSQANAVRLMRPLRETIRTSLVDMEIDEDCAQALARDSGRSLAVLRRLIPAAPGTIAPKWAIPEHARVLIPALFAGAWSEANEGDRTVLERLSGETYEKWIASLTQWMNWPDSPLRKEGNTWKIASPRDAWFRLAPYASPVDLETFSALTIDVLGERSPLYDMSADERWMAPVRGQRPKHSELLRDGMAETLVLLSVFGEQIRCSRNASTISESIVRRLLDDADGPRWWSLSKLLQSLAEAAPEAFLSAVDDSLSVDPPPIMVLFKEDEGAFGRAYHSHLLWALEILAWSPYYLARVSTILAKLAQRDLDGRFSNRPKNSLRNIFLLWRPHTYATLDERLRALDALRRVEPGVAWELLMRTIPTGSDIAEGPSKPRWRDFSPEQEEIVTYGLLAKGVAEITDRLLEDAGLDAARWSRLIESYANVPIEKRRPLLEGLSVAVAQICDATTRLKIRETLRRFLHRHRAYPEVKWRLPDEELLRLDEIYLLLEPSDPIGKFGWLFSSQSSEPPRPTGEGWKADGDLVHQMQRDAVRDILAKGEEELFRFTNSVEAPAQVGIVLADVIEERDRQHAILARSLNGQTATDDELARGMLLGLFGLLGETWAGALLTQANDERWSAEAVTKVVLTLPPSRFVWKWLERFEPQVERTYWSQTDLLWMKGDPDDRAFAANELIEAHRARAAVHFMGRSPRDFPSSLLVHALYEAVGERWPKDEGNEGTMFVYSVEEIFIWLGKANDVAEDQIATLEWALLPLLQHSHRVAPVVLHRRMSTAPSFFVEVISAVYRPAPDSGVVEPTPADAERAGAIARQAYELLRSWMIVPGLDNGLIDATVLEEWVKDTRILCKNGGRLAVGDQHIGSVLAYAPADSAGIWPAVEVRELVEITRSKDLETGIFMGVHNRRGATMRGMTDGGAQERDLAKTYRGWSRNTALEWPRTSALLERIASSYENEARRHDEDAERNQW